MMHKKSLETTIGRSEIEVETELNWELSPIRVGDTRLNIYYITLLSLVELFSFFIEVLEYVEYECINSFSQQQAGGIRIYHRSFFCIPFAIDVASFWAHKHSVTISTNKISRYKIFVTQLSQHQERWEVMSLMHLCWISPHFKRKMTFKYWM